MATILSTLIIVTVSLIVALVLFTLISVKLVEKSLPPLGRMVNTSHAQFHIYEKGTGPYILLIHGLAAQLGQFNCGLIDQLAKNYRVIAIDRPGSGYSKRQRNTSASLSAQADSIAELMQKLDMQQTTVVGHSLGGSVALALAQRHSNNVSALALISPVTHTPATTPKAFKPLEIHQAWLRHIISWTLSAPINMILHRRIVEAIFSPEAVPKDFYKCSRTLLTIRPSHFVATTTDLADAFNKTTSIIENYQYMNLPVSILYGRNDRILDPQEQGVALQKSIPNAQLTLIDGGHMLPITALEPTVSFIQKVAEQVSSKKQPEIK